MKVLIATPVYYREQKVKNFLASILYSNYSMIDVRLVIAINECNDGLRDYIKKYATDFTALHGSGSCDVMSFEKNVGKGKAINDAVTKHGDEFAPDFICSIDSDMVFIDVDWLNTLLGTFDAYEAHYKGRTNVPPLGLSAPNMIQDDNVSENVHRLKSGFGIKVGQYSCWTSTSNQGIGGGCFLILYDLFKKIGGYHTRTFIGGNDAHMLGELDKLGYKAVINISVNAIHPKGTDSEKDYMKWKRDMTTQYITRKTNASDYNGTKNF